MRAACSAAQPARGAPVSGEAAAAARRELARRRGQRLRRKVEGPALERAARAKAGSEAERVPPPPPLLSTPLLLSCRGLSRRRARCTSARWRRRWEAHAERRGAQVAQQLLEEEERERTQEAARGKGGGKGGGKKKKGRG